MSEIKKTKLIYFILGAAVSLTAVFLIGLLIWKTPYSSYVDDPTSLDAAKKTREITWDIDHYYLGEANSRNLADYMYLGLVAGLEDPYSTYFTKDEFETISMGQKGDYRGIGVTVSNREDGALQITDVTEDGPAMKAGVQAGDVVLAVDGQDFKNAATSEVVDYIRALETDSLELKVFRESTQEELSFSIPLEELEDFSVKHKMMEDDIGYIYISSFTARTCEQFMEARDDLEDQGMKALIVDLRDNTGGLVSAVRDVLCSFMPEGLLFYTEDKEGVRKEFSSEGVHPIDLPMAVLVNAQTASASEIFSGAVQDHKVGTIIGTVTYGKGIVQNSYGLSDGSVLRITVSHYYTPLGNDIHEAGITPDIIVENEAGEDTQFNRAVEVLKEQI